MEKIFKLKENGTNVKTEIIAGITTFLAMAYILAVNPSILSAAGMDPKAIRDWKSCWHGWSTKRHGIMTSPYMMNMAIRSERQNGTGKDVKH